MRQSLAIALIALGSGFVCTSGIPLAAGQEQQADSKRKVLNRVAPIYPELAKRMNVTGTVRLIAVVAPNGSVTRTQIVGGSLLLVQAAENAIYKWKWTAAVAETQEVVEIRFKPEQ